LFVFSQPIIEQALYNEIATETTLVPERPPTGLDLNPVATKLVDEQLAFTAPFVDTDELVNLDIDLPLDCADL